MLRLLGYELNGKLSIIFEKSVSFERKNVYVVVLEFNDPMISQNCRELLPLFTTLLTCASQTSVPNLFHTRKKDQAASRVVNDH